MNLRMFVLISSLYLLPASAALAVTFEMAHVGNPGNPDFTGGTYPFGGVAYEYQISKTEVATGQYLEFMNAVDPEGTNALGLYDGPLMFSLNGIVLDSTRPAGMKYDFWGAPADFAHLPVAVTSWYSAARFANWMHNGQGHGDTETGSYTLVGSTPTPQNASDIQRNPGATWVIPSIDEWYKAAFHKNDGPTAHYWTYATSRDSQPYSARPPGYGAPDPANTGNFYADDGIANGYNNGYARTGDTQYFPGQITTTDVGAYVFSVSPYGTWDQFGNLDEWTDTPGPVEDSMFSGPENRNDFGYMGLNVRGAGFRLAEVPEPALSSFIVVLSAWACTARQRKSPRLR